MQYMNEFLTIALVHLVAVASPGPDFAVVVRNSVAYGRRTAMFTSVGIGLAILLHVAYSLVGLSVVIATTPWLFTTFSYAAAAYLPCVRCAKKWPGEAKRGSELRKQNIANFSETCGVDGLSH